MAGKSQELLNYYGVRSLKNSSSAILFNGGMAIFTLKQQCVRQFSLLNFLYKALNINWFVVMSLICVVLLFTGGVAFAKLVPFSSVDFMTLLIGGAGYFLVMAIAIGSAFVGSVFE